AGTDRAHDPEFQRRALELDETRGKVLRLLRLPLNLLEIRTHRLPELAQMRSRPLAMEQEAAELVLQELDGTRERRLRHVAFLGRAGEVQLLAQGEEIPNLMHFHGDNPLSVRSRPRANASACSRTGRRWNNCGVSFRQAAAGLATHCARH